MKTKTCRATMLWCVVIFVSVSGFFLIVERTSSWDLVGVPKMPSPPLMFADTIGVLAASDCQNRGVNVYQNNPCDPWGRVQVLGNATSYLGRVGLDISDGDWLGWTLGFLFLFSTLLLVRPCGPFQASLTLMLLVSPATMLAGERANIDLFSDNSGVI